MLKVGVIGAAGRMGRLACEAIEATDDLGLVARVGRGDSLDQLEGADITIDLSAPAAVMDHIDWCVRHGVNVVAGTSGFTDERLSMIEESLRSRPEVGVIVVPNFSIGAVLMMRFAAEAAGFFDSVELIELHHPAKIDAPSGTALRTAALMAAARRGAGRGPMPDSTVDNTLGTRGGQVSGVPVHSVRLRGLVAHQEVLFGNEGETLKIRHDMPDRAAAMPGLLAATRAVVDRPGLTVGLEHVLGLGS
ncbi:MAG: 4-hydroxy-tetrahydrodipicolinate reductase [Nocardioidaceae bacterium]